MKKEFRKPILKRCELRLDENIAYSWEYYYDKGLISTSFKFTYSNPATGGIITHEQGCFTYLTNNMSWDTGNYSGPNEGLLMADYLLHDLLVAAYNQDPHNHYITDCYSSTIPSH